MREENDDDTDGEYEAEDTQSGQQTAAHASDYDGR